MLPLLLGVTLAHCLAIDVSLIFRWKVLVPIAFSEHWSWMRRWRYCDLESTQESPWLCFHPKALEDGLPQVCSRPPWA